MFYINSNDVKYFHEDDQDSSKRFGIMTSCVYNTSNVSAFQISLFHRAF